MLLAFDVGNSNIVLGVFKDGKLVTNWRIETDNNKSADEYGMIVTQLFQYEGLQASDVKRHHYFYRCTVSSLHAAALGHEVFLKSAPSL